MVILFRLDFQMRETTVQNQNIWRFLSQLQYIVIQLCSFISFPYSSIMQILRAQSQQQRHFEELPPTPGYPISTIFYRKFFSFFV